jgi:hypothetical protein
MRRQLGGLHLQTATGSSSSSADEFARTRFPDGYRVELIEQRAAREHQLTNVRFLDGYRVEIIERV